MRKNFTRVVHYFQKVRRSTGIPVKTANKLLGCVVAFLAVVPFVLLEYIGSSSDCDQCSFIVASRPDTFNAAEWFTATHFSDKVDNPCPAESPLEFRCDLIFKAKLIWLLVVWQWLVTIRAIFKRPHIYLYLQRRKPELGSVNDASAEEEACNEQEGSTAVDPTDLYEEHRAFRKLEDVVTDDTNWQYVVVEACYAGMVGAGGVLVLLVLTSHRGIMFAIGTFLVVSSGQCLFYAAIWFIVHWLSTISDAISFTQKLWKQHCVLKTLISTSAALYVVFLCALYIEFDQSYVVVAVSVYSLATVFPVVTFAAFKVREAQRMAPDTDSEPEDDRMELLPYDFDQYVDSKRHVRRDSDPGTHIDLTGSFETMRRQFASAPVSPQRTDETSGLRQRRRGPAKDSSTVKSIQVDGEFLSSFKTISHDPKTQPASSNDQSASASPQPPELDDVAPKTSCCRVRKIRSRAGKRQSLHTRYNAYMGVSLLMGAVILVILVASLQRMVQSPEEIPHSFSVDSVHEGALSVILQIQNVTLATGHLVHRKFRKGSHDNATAAKDDTKLPLPPSYCSHHIHGLTLAQYCLLSQLPYLPPKTKDFNRFRDFLFPDFKVKMAHLGGFPNDTQTGRDSSGDGDQHQTTMQSRVVFYELYSEKRNLSLVVIRGTTAFEFSDWVADIDVWLEAAGVQLWSKFLPGLSLWPSSLIARIIYLVSVGVERVLPNSLLERDRHYYLPVLEHVQTIQHPVVVVGHSMAGGIAKIVGALSDVPAVSLSGPGLLETRSKLKISLAMLNKNVVNIIPSSDIIAKIGKPGGTTFNIVCDDSSPWFCHFPMNVGCTILRQCGYPELELDCKFEKHSTS